jgi:single-stranded-DNA-specific exonuclease
MDNPVLFVYSSDWFTGIVGLIAGRIKEKYGKPTIAMTANAATAMGSGRSIEGFNMIEALQSMPELFDKFGGHPMACGFSLKNHDLRPELQKRMTEVFVEQTKELDLTPLLDIDMEIDFDQLNLDMYDNSLSKFAPYGQMNHAPKYLTRGLEVTKIKAVGKEGKHLTLMVRHNGGRIHKTIGWSLCATDDGVDWSKKIRIGDTIDLVYEISLNVWNGNRELQLTIIDLKKSK